MGYKVLSLDQSTAVLGFCLMEDCVPIKKGSIDFSKCKSSVEKISQCRKAIKLLIKMTQPEIIAIEDIQAQVNQQTFKILAELKGAIENLIYDEEFLYFVLSPSEWRSIIGLKPKSRKREDCKKAAIEFVKDNFDIELDDDEDCVESICIAYAVSKKYIPQIKVSIDTDLFE